MYAFIRFDYDDRDGLTAGQRITSYETNLEHAFPKVDRWIVASTLERIAEKARAEGLTHLAEVVQEACREGRCLPNKAAVYCKDGPFLILKDAGNEETQYIRAAAESGQGNK